MSFESFDWPLNPGNPYQEGFRADLQRTDGFQEFDTDPPNITLPDSQPETMAGTIRFIAEQSGAMGITYATIVGERRTSKLSFWRHICYLALSEKFDHYTSAVLGDAMNRDHTTILAGVERAKQRYEAEPDFKWQYDRIMAEMA